jgi:hypothetical protein
MATRTGAHSLHSDSAREPSDCERADGRPRITLSKLFGSPAILNEGSTGAPSLATVLVSGRGLISSSPHFNLPGNQQRVTISVGSARFRSSACLRTETHAIVAPRLSARERNFLSWLKLTVSLAVISAALLVRFQFGGGTLPDWEKHAQEPVRSSLRHKAV